MAEVNVESENMQYDKGTTRAVAESGIVKHIGCEGCSVGKSPKRECHTGSSFLSLPPMLKPNLFSNHLSKATR